MKKIVFDSSNLVQKCVLINRTFTKSLKFLAENLQEAY